MLQPQKSGIIYVPWTRECYLENLERNCSNFLILWKIQERNSMVQFWNSWYVQLNLKHSISTRDKHSTRKFWYRIPGFLWSINWGIFFGIEKRSLVDSLFLSNILVHLGKSQCGILIKKNSLVFIRSLWFSKIWWSSLDYICLLVKWLSFIVRFRPHLLDDNLSLKKKQELIWTISINWVLWTGSVGREWHFCPFLGP